MVVEAAEHAELVEEDLNAVCGTSLRRKPLQHAQLQPAPQPRCEHVAPGVEKGLHIDVVLAPAPRLRDTLTHQRAEMKLERRLCFAPLRRGRVEGGVAGREHR